MIALTLLLLLLLLLLLSSLSLSLLSLLFLLLLLLLFVFPPARTMLVVNLMLIYQDLEELNCKRSKWELERAGQVLKFIW